MEKRIRPSKTGLFAIELLAAAGVFVLCAAICVGVFARAEVMSRESEMRSRAVNAARNVAECFKASEGDLARTAALCGGTEDGGALYISYDADWLPPDAEGAARFRLSLVPAAAAGYTEAEIQVERLDLGEMLLRWTVAALPEAAA